MMCFDLKSQRWGKHEKAAIFARIGNVAAAARRSAQRVAAPLVHTLAELDPSAIPPPGDFMSAAPKMQEAVAPAIQVDEIDPLMFAQLLADHASRASEYQTKVVLMIASATILKLANGFDLGS